MGIIIEAVRCRWCRLRERTYSVWGHMSKYITDFTNPFYKKDVEKASQLIVIPVTNSQSFKSVSSLLLSHTDR